MRVTARTPIDWIRSASPEAREFVRSCLDQYLKTDRLQDYRATSKQLEFHALGALYPRVKNRMLQAGNQIGKALANDTPILTRDGFKPMGELAVGDRVYGSDGRPTEVLGVYPQGMRPTWRVRTNDGASVVCDTEHLWTVQRKARRSGAIWSRRDRGGPDRWQTVPFSRVLDDGFERYTWPVPNRPVIEYGPGSALPIDPYVYGCLLGDGSTAGTPQLTTMDPEILNACAAEAARFGLRTTRERDKGGERWGTYRFTPGNNTSKRNPLTEQLRLIGADRACPHKEIALAYLRAPAVDRIALMQGLMDTDGHIGSGKGNGSPMVFTAASPKLATDFLELAHSLGFKASVTRKAREHHEWWHVVLWWNPRICPFRLTRKVRRWDRKRARSLRRTAHKARHLSLAGAEFAGMRPCTCIKVAAADRLFLAGEGLIPTHNTYAAGAETALHLTGEYPKWWRGYRFTKPIVCWVGGVTGEAVRDLAQKMLLGRPKQEGTGWIPKRCLTGIASKSSQVTDLYDFIFVRHVSGGLSMLRFKYYSQHVDTWMGESCDLLWMDEEASEKIYHEAIARTIATKGISMLTFTPKHGYTPVVNLYNRDRHPETSGRAMVQMNIRDADHLTKEEQDAEIARWPKHQQRSVIWGLPAVGEGQIYPFEEDEIYVDKMPVPDWFAVLAAIDFGGAAPTAHPTAAVKLAWDREDDVIYVTREYRRNALTPPEHWLRLKHWGKDLSWAWPRDALIGEKASGEALIQIYRGEGMLALRHFAQWPSERRRKRPGAPGAGTAGLSGVVSVDRGILEVYDRFETGRLKIFRSCPMIYEEMRTYHREDAKIVKANDDLLDALRYGVMMLRFARPPRDARRRQRTGTPDALIGI